MNPTLGQLLRDGLRSGTFRRPQCIEPLTRLGPVLALALLDLITGLPGEWMVAEAPRHFSFDGLMTALAAFALYVLAAWLLAAWTQRRELWLTISAWFFGISILINIVSLPLNVFDQAITDALMSIAYRLEPSLAAGMEDLQQGNWIEYVLLTLWWLASCVYVARALAASIPRVLGGGISILVFTVLPWWLTYPANVIDTDWIQLYEQERVASGDGDEVVASAELPTPEATIYAQGERLDGALAALAPQRPDHIDLFAIGFAGDADEGAFRNEVEFLPQLIAQRFNNPDHTVRLINAAETADEVPLATVTNLERALHGVAERMDLEQDILMLYLVSHGSEDHLLYVNQPPLPLRQLSPQRLRVALDEAGIRWRVIVVSACYSGGFLEPLSDPHTLVITAARADRTSFGCGNSANATWFGQAFLIEALNQTTQFRRAFLKAQGLVAEREAEENEEPSEPQWQAGEAISDYLRAWSEQLPERPAVAFVPAVEVVSESGENSAAKNATDVEVHTTKGSDSH
jgi:hypothetical protein